MKKKKKKKNSRKNIVWLKCNKKTATWSASSLLQMMIDYFHRKIDDERT